MYTYAYTTVACVDTLVEQCPLSVVLYPQASSLYKVGMTTQTMQPCRPQETAPIWNTGSQIAGQARLLSSVAGQCGHFLRCQGLVQQAASCWHAAGYCQAQDNARSDEQVPG